MLLTSSDSAPTAAPPDTGPELHVVALCLNMLDLFVTLLHHSISAVHWPLVGKRAGCFIKKVTLGFCLPKKYTYTSQALNLAVARLLDHPLIAIELVICIARWVSAAGPTVSVACIRLTTASG